MRFEGFLKGNCRNLFCLWTTGYICHRETLLKISVLLQYCGIMQITMQDFGCNSIQPEWRERCLWCIASENSVFCRKYTFLLKFMLTHGLFSFRHLWRLRTSLQFPFLSSVLSEDSSRNEWLNSMIILSTVATSRKEKGMWEMSL